MRGVQSIQSRRIERCGALDQAVAVLETQFADHQPGFAVQQRVVVQAGTATIRQLVAPRLRRIHLGDAIRIGKGEQVAELMMRIEARDRIALQMQPAPPLLRGLVDQSQGAAIGGVDATPAAEVVQCVQAITQVFRAPRLAAQRIAAVEQGGDIARQCAFVAARAHQQVGDAWMRAEREQLLAMRGDAAVAVEGIQRLQQRHGCGLRSRRRCVEQA